jgi:hypothetical protein
VFECQALVGGEHGTEEGEAEQGVVEGGQGLEDPRWNQPGSIGRLCPLHVFDFKLSEEVVCYEIHIRGLWAIGTRSHTPRVLHSS